MGIVSVLFLIFGWIFGVKGLVITSLVISSFFIFCLTLACFMINSNDEKFHKGLIEDIIQIIVLILSIVRITKGF